VLDMKRSMGVNIFLKQFKMPNNAIVDLIKQGDVEKLGAEKLKGLMSLLPTKDEVCARSNGSS
jgi:inverted formin-2